MCIFCFPCSYFAQQGVDQLKSEPLAVAHSHGALRVLRVLAMYGKSTSFEPHLHVFLLYLRYRYFEGYGENKGLLVCKLKNSARYPRKLITNWDIFR